MQATVVSTETLSPSDGVQMWRDVVCRSLVALDVKPADPGRFFGRIAAGELGRLTMTDITSRPQDAHRTHRLIPYDQQRSLKTALPVEPRFMAAHHHPTLRPYPRDLVP